MMYDKHIQAKEDVTTSHTYHQVCHWHCVSHVDSSLATR